MQSSSPSTKEANENVTVAELVQANAQRLVLVSLFFGYTPSKVDCLPNNGRQTKC
jgi:hypothetical protein